MLMITHSDNIRKTSSTKSKTNEQTDHSFPPYIPSRSRDNFPFPLGNKMFYFFCFSQLWVFASTQVLLLAHFAVYKKEKYRLKVDVRIVLFSDFFSWYINT